MVNGSVTVFPFLVIFPIPNNLVFGYLVSGYPPPFWLGGFWLIWLFGFWLFGFWFLVNLVLGYLVIWFGSGLKIYLKPSPAAETPTSLHKLKKIKTRAGMSRSFGSVFLYQI